MYAIYFHGILRTEQLMAAKLVPVFPPFSQPEYLRQSSSRLRFVDTPGGDA